MAKETATLAEVREYFQGRKIVSRTDINSFQENVGKNVPKSIWDMKVARNQYDLYAEQGVIVQEDVKQVHTKTVIQEEVAMIVQEPELPRKPELVSREVNVFNIDSFVPAVNPNYVPWGNFKDIDTLVKSNEFFTLYITGESGTGKNAMIEQVCAKNKRLMVRINFTRDTKEEHIIGSKTLIDGNIVYEDGPAIWAAEHGAILVLDEISAADANEVLCIQNVMEGGEFFVKSLNRIVKPIPGFAIIASDNTKGQGSDSGRYIGTNVLNTAFLDRFDMMLVQEYPSIKIERQIMSKAYGSFNQEIDEKFIEDVCNWIQIIRRTYQQDAIDDMVSTRRAIKIIKARALWFSPEKAIQYGITRFDETTAAAFKILWDKLQTGELQKVAEE